VKRRPLLPMLLRQKHFLPREPAEQQFLLKSSRAFARGLLPRKKMLRNFVAFVF
jgi:hypothetical protein